MNNLEFTVTRRVQVDPVVVETVLRKALIMLSRSTYLGRNINGLDRDKFIGEFLARYEVQEKKLLPSFTEVDNDDEEEDDV